MRLLLNLLISAVSIMASADTVVDVYRPEHTHLRRRLVKVPIATASSHGSHHAPVVPKPKPITPKAKKPKNPDGKTRSNSPTKDEVMKASKADQKSRTQDVEGKSAKLGRDLERRSPIVVETEVEAASIKGAKKHRSRPKTTEPGKRTMIEAGEEAMAVVEADRRIFAEQEIAMVKADQTRIVDAAEMGGSMVLNSEVMGSRSKRPRRTKEEKLARKMEKKMEALRPEKHSLGALDGIFASNSRVGLSDRIEIGATLHGNDSILHPAENLINHEFAQIERSPSLENNVGSNYRLGSEAMTRDLELVKLRYEQNLAKKALQPINEFASVEANSFTGPGLAAEVHEVPMHQSFLPLKRTVSGPMVHQRANAWETKIAEAKLQREQELLRVLELKSKNHKN